MLHTRAIVVLGADKDSLEPMPVLHRYRVKEPQPFCSQVDRFRRSGSPYVTCRQRFRGRPTQSWYQIKDGEDDDAEHDKQTRLPTAAAARYRRTRYLLK